VRFIVDTSVWSLAFRRHRPSDASEVEKLKTLIEEGEDIYLLGMILMEVLQGIREKRRYHHLRETMAVFPILEPARDDYAFCAQIRDQCASRGIHASTIDFLIAGMCLRKDAWLLTADTDFRRIGEVVPLKLA
jgi:predicted nucleic acid-binding protein